MTFYHIVDGDELVVYEVTTQTAEVARIPNDGSGFEIPGDVLAVMRAELVEEANLGGGDSPVVSTRAIHILLDMASEDIEPGVPDGL